MNYGKFANRDKIWDMKSSDITSSCPINYTLETLGNRWALLIVRDIALYGKRTYGEFLHSEEGVTTSMLADRLLALEREGIITKKRSTTDRRKEIYDLGEKGRTLIPVLLELSNWGMHENGLAELNPAWIEQIETKRDTLLPLIYETLDEGGSVFAGEGSVVQKLAIQIHLSR